MSFEKPITRKRNTTRPPLLLPRRKGWSTGCWASFSFFLLTLLVILLAVVFFWSPISAYLPALFAMATPTASATASATALPVLATDTPLPPLPSSTLTHTPTDLYTLTETPTPPPTLTPSITPTPTQTPTLTPTGLGGGYGQIAFASSRTGLPQIYVMNSDGSGLRQVTTVAGGACQPDWSPDGTRIVFTSPCADRKDQYPDAQLFTINVDGSGLTPLSNGRIGEFDPAWSPDGSRIAFTSMQDGTAQIAVLNLSDLTVTHLTKTSSDIRFPQESSQPVWSPDGSLIDFTAKRLGVFQIWSMGDSGLKQAQLVRSGSALWDFLPSWSPDEKTILFSETNGPQALGWLMVFHPGVTGSIASRFTFGNYATDAEFSPDGHWVVFEGTEDGINYDVYRITSDGRNRTRLTTEGHLDFDPAWRPAGLP